LANVVGVEGEGLCVKNKAANLRWVSVYDIDSIIFLLDCSWDLIKNILSLFNQPCVIPNPNCFYVCGTEDEKLARFNTIARNAKDIKPKKGHKIALRES